MKAWISGKAASSNVKEETKVLEIGLQAPKAHWTLNIMCNPDPLSQLLANVREVSIVTIPDHFIPVKRKPTQHLFGYLTLTPRNIMSSQKPGCHHPFTTEILQLFGRVSPLFGMAHAVLDLSGSSLSSVLTKTLFFRRLMLDSVLSYNFLEVALDLSWSLVLS